jgi:hypothetical protein
VIRKTRAPATCLVEEGELITAAIEVPRCYSFSIKIQYYIVQ